MENGLIQVYYGDGKGKSTAAMGQALRACGHGMKVLIFQFLKDGTSGEISILKTLPGVDYMENDIDVPFLFNLTDEQKEYFSGLYCEKFEELCEKIRTGGYDMAVLDEILDAYGQDFLPLEEICKLMENKPAGCELVLTGHDYGKDLSGIFERADYVTNVKKIRHPFDKGVPCRKGIEE